MWKADLARDCERVGPNVPPGFPGLLLRPNRRLLSIAEDHGFQIWKAAGTIVLGAAQVGVGRAEERLANVSAGMNLYQGLRSPPVFWPMPPLPITPTIP